MAGERGLIAFVVRDRNGHALQNALVRVREFGTTTAVTDLFADPTGGSAISGGTLTSNSRGEAVGYLNVQRRVTLNVSDNSGAAIDTTTSDPVTFTAFDRAYDPEPRPQEVAQLDEANVFSATNRFPATGVEMGGSTFKDAGLGIGAVAGRPAFGTAYREWFDPNTGRGAVDTGAAWVDRLASAGGSPSAFNFGTFAARPVSPATNEYYYATNNDRLYRWSGSIWKPLDLGDKVWVVDFAGGIPDDGVTDNKAAIEAAMVFARDNGGSVFFTSKGPSYSVLTQLTPYSIFGSSDRPHFLGGNGRTNSTTVGMQFQHGPMVRINSGHATQPAVLITGAPGFLGHFTNLSFSGNQVGFRAINVSQVWFEHCHFVAFTKPGTIQTDAALVMENVWGVLLYRCSFQSVDNTRFGVVILGRAPVTVEVDSSYQVNFYECWFHFGVVYWEQIGATGGPLSGPCSMYQCYSENAALPFFDIGTFMNGGLTIDSCGHFDQVGTPPLVHTRAGSGSVQSVLLVATGGPAGKAVQLESTGLSRRMLFQGISAGQAVVDDVGALTTLADIVKVAGDRVDIFGLDLGAPVPLAEWWQEATGSLRLFKTGETFARIGVTWDKIRFGSGAAEWDASANLYRSALNTLKTDGALAVGTVVSAYAVLVTDSLRAGLAADTASGGPVLAMENAAVVPSTTPVGGGVVYVDAGALKYKGSAGTVTTLAAA